MKERAGLQYAEVIQHVVHECAHTVHRDAPVLTGYGPITRHYQPNRVKLM